MTWLENIGLEQPTANEFLAQPDLRQISTFFLGSTFIVSLYYLLQSRPALYLRRRINRLFAPRSGDATRPAVDLEAGSVTDEKVIAGLTSKDGYPVTWNRDPVHFVFFLTLSAAIASLMQFLSLLAYGSRADVACAFVVAWGGMAAQCIRLFGLLKISFVLQDYGARRWEVITFWVMLCVAIGLMLFTGATSVGTVRGVDILPTLAFCYRKHFLLSGLSSGLVNIALEAYSIVRLFVLTVPPFLKLQHQFQALIDVRLGWGASLLLLDLLTLVPALVPITIAADFVPFSIGTLIVLYAFNRVVPPPVSDIDTMTIPGTIAITLPPGDDAGPVSQFEGQSQSHEDSSQIHTGDANPSAPGTGHHTQAAASVTSLESITWPVPPPTAPRPSIAPQAPSGRSRAIFPGQSQYIPSPDIHPYARHELSAPPPPPRGGYRPDIRIEIPGASMPPPAPPRAMVIEQRTPPDTSKSSIKYGSDILAGSTRNAMKRHSATSSAPEFASRDSTFSSPVSVYPYGAYGTPGILSPGDDHSEIGYLSPGSDMPKSTIMSKRLTFGKSPRPGGPRDRPRPPPLEPVAGQKRAAPGSDAPPPSAVPSGSAPLSALPRSDAPRLSASRPPSLANRRKSIGPPSKRTSNEPSRRMTMRFPEERT